jgi:ribosomal protein S18 acetylase RimI-like enzyme
MTNIEYSLPSGMENAAAKLYWEAFGEKLGTLLGPAHRGERFFCETINPPSVIAATQDGELLGIVAFKSSGKGFSDAGLRDLFRHYGIGAFWRLIPLAMLERSSADDTLQMDGICVSASARGKGVGSALFDALFAYARKRDYSYITLDVIDTNPRAKALYERLGFEATKTEGTSVLKPILGFSYATKMRRAL